MLLVSASCETSTEKLKIYGRRELKTTQVDGKEVVDTVYYSVPDFKFINQYGDSMSLEDVKGKIFCVDFFFTRCQAICPIVKKNMLPLQETYGSDDEIVFLSHSLDPDNDTPAELMKYSKKLGATASNWFFLTGNKRALYEMAFNGYMVPAQEDPEIQGGIDHSGRIVLLDKAKRIRGYYEGTKPEEVERLIEDISILKKEE